MKRKLLKKLEQSLENNAGYVECLFGLGFKDVSEDFLN